MSEERYITIMSHRRKTVLNVSSILYVLMSGKNATIHVAGDRVYQTRMGLAQLEQALARLEERLRPIPACNRGR